MSNVSIVGLDKVDVLIALYNNSRPQGMGFLHYDPKPMTRDEAEKLLQRSTYFDYLNGRVMKVNLEGDDFDPWLYDRDNGEGSAQRAINELRTTGDTNSEVIQATHKEQVTKAAGIALEAMQDNSGFMGEKDGFATFHLGLDPNVKPFIDQALEDTE